MSSSRPSLATSNGALRRALPRLLFESALIVFSILLALAVSEWRDERETRRTVETALETVRQEIERNREAVASSLPYHREMIGRLERFLEGPEPAREVSERGWIEVLAELAPRGLLPPTLSTTAWETARAQGVPAELEFDTAHDLARLYFWQEQSVGRTWPRIADAVLAVEAFDRGRSQEDRLRYVLVATQELAAQEAELLGAYDRILEDLFGTPPASEP